MLSQLAVEIMKNMKVSSKSRAKSGSEPFIYFILLSFFIHLLVLLGIEDRKQSRPLKSKKIDYTPIEFVIPRPEENPKKIPKVNRIAAINSVEKGIVKPEKKSVTNTIESNKAKSDRKSINKSKQKVFQSQPFRNKSTMPSKSIKSRSSNAKQDLEKLQPKKQIEPKEKAKNKLPIKEDLVSSGNSASLLGGNYGIGRDVPENSGSSIFNLEVSANHRASQQQIAARQDELGIYLTKLREKVKKHWRPSNLNNNHYTVLAFTIDRNGNISRLRVLQSSGSKLADRQAIVAIEKSSPFAPLPESYPGERFNLDFSFNIYVYPSRF